MDTNKARSGQWLVAVFCTFFWLVFHAGPVEAKEVSIDNKAISLNANLVLAGGKSLSDPVILMTHGTLAHNRMELIATMQKLLAERGYSTLAINLGLGLNNRHGMYDCKVPHRHLHQDALDEIGLWIDWLKSKGTKKVVLMGHSRGGGQTAWFAAERPDPAVVAAVLMAPATWNEKAARDDYKKNFGVPVGPILKKARKLVAAGKGDEMMKVPGFVYCRDAMVTARAFLSYHGPEPRRHSPGMIAKITVPVLVIAGANDTVVKGLPQAVKPLMDGRQKVLKVVEDADHFFLDFAAEDAADAIDAFLQGRLD